MFLGKMALSSKTPKLTLKILNLAIAAVVVGITGLVWLGPDAAEAAGRKVTLTWNEIITPSATTTTPFSAAPANAPCLVSVAEWEPLGSRVEIQFILLSRPSGTSEAENEAISSDRRAINACVSGFSCPFPTVLIGPNRPVEPVFAAEWLSGPSGKPASLSARFLPRSLGLRIKS